MNAQLTILFHQKEYSDMNNYVSVQLRKWKENNSPLVDYVREEVICTDGIPDAFRTTFDSNIPPEHQLIRQAIKRFDELVESRKQ